MNLHDVISQFEAEIAAFFNRFRSHPAVQAAAAAQPVESAVAAAQVIADPVVAAPVAPPPSATDLLFPGANQPGDARTQPAQAIPDGWFVMDGELRNGRTALVYGADNGVLFGAKPGKTTYTMTIPPDMKEPQALHFNKDGMKTGKENCTVSVNGGPPQDVFQSGNDTVVLRTPGDYALEVECDALFTITPNATT